MKPRHKSIIPMTVIGLFILLLILATEPEMNGRVQAISNYQISDGDTLFTIDYSLGDFDIDIKTAINEFLTIHVQEIPTQERRYTVTVQYEDSNGIQHIKLFPTEVYESYWIKPYEESDVISLAISPKNVGENWVIEFEPESNRLNSVQLVTAAYSFPWSNGQSWAKTQGFHFNTMGYSLDFAPRNGASNNVLAIESGTFAPYCYISGDPYQAMVKVTHSGGVESGYLHLAKGSIPSNLFNQSIPKGQIVGSLYTGSVIDNPNPACTDLANYKFATACGCGYATHLHFETNSLITIQGNSLSTISSAINGTQYTSNNSGGGCCGCATGTQTPVYNTAFLTDAELTAYNSMSKQEIRNFLTAHNSYFKNPVTDVDGVTFDMAAVMAQAATTYQISPKVLLATLQKETSSVTNSSRPTSMGWIMGCGSSSTARSQVTCAASSFRAYQDSLLSSGQTVSGWRVGVAKQTSDGITVTPATNAVAGQFTYTPYAGAGWGGNYGGVNLFYQVWTSFGFGPGLANNTFVPFPDLVGPPAPADLIQPAIPGFDNNAFTPTTGLFDPIVPTKEWVQSINSAPEWTTDVIPNQIVSQTAAPPLLSWPEAVDDSGKEVTYLVYWGDDPAGTGEMVTAVPTYTPPTDPISRQDSPAIYYLRAAPRDETGQVGGWQTVAVWRYDPIAPVGTLTLQGGGSVIKTLNATLQIAAEDIGSGVAQMRFSDDGQTWTDWEPFTSQYNWHLDEVGRQTIYAQVQDEAGNVSETIATTVTADLTLTLPTSANYALGCHTFSIGGGAKSSNSYTVHSVTGQPYETGTMQSGSYQVNSGYWPACGSAAAAPPTGSPIRLSPAAQTVALADGEFCLDVTTADVADLGGFEFELSFPPASLQATQATLGAFLTSTGRTAVPVGPTINNTAGTVTFGAGTVGSQAGPDGGGTLAAVCFNPQQAGTAVLDFNSGQLTDTLGDPLSSYLAGGTVTIQGSGCYWADMDCDNDVDIADIQKVAGRWGTQVGDTGYSAFYDLDDDGDIDIVDVQKVASQWGWPNAPRTSLPATGTGTINLSLTPSLFNIQPGQTKTIDLEVTNAANLASFESALTYNPSELAIDSISFSNFLEGSGRNMVTVGPVIHNQTGTATFGATTFGSQAGVSGNGILVTIQITAKTNGNGVIDLNNSQATDPDAVLIPVTENDASYRIGYDVYLPVIVR